MEDTGPSAAKMRFCLREVAYGFVPSGKAYPHSETRPKTHLESLAGMACDKRLCQGLVVPTETWNDGSRMAQPARLQGWSF